MKPTLLLAIVLAGSGIRLRGERMHGRVMRDVFGCTDLMIGDGHCDEYCLYNFDDGGDCNRSDYCEAFGEDGWCDPICYDEENDWDSGDCKECKEGWMGDQYCDIACNDETMDGGDCVCEMEMIGNEKCDVGCLKAEFKYDGGDCYKFKNI